MKTRNCDECAFAEFTTNKMICGKGHKPRFYKPVGTYPYFENNWGWKRRCEDFEKGTPKGITVEYFQVFNAPADRMEPPATFSPADGCDNSNTKGE